MLLNFYYENKSKFVYIVLLALLLVSQSFTSAQTGTIKGTVTDKSTKETLVGANILVQGTNLGAAADIDGNFIIYNVSAGSHVLLISYVGYKSTSINIRVEAGRTNEINIKLVAEAIEGKVVTVTAQAAGQLQAINEQLASNNIVNVVSAEKMQELPDANIAESIGRLPGISLQRNAGEAYAVVVRGLSPQYNQVSVEGVPMTSTNYYDRSVDLSLLSDNMVKGVEVSKTLRPDMDADALGGTVNLTLRTADPGFKYSLGGNGAYTDLRYNTNNYKFNGTVSDRFLNDKVGALFQASIEEKQLPSDQFNAGYSGPEFSGSNYISGNPYYINTNNVTLSDNNIKRRRYGVSLVLDYASDFVDIKFFNLFDVKKDSSLTRNYELQFNSNELDQDLYIGQTTTQQRTHSIQALFKFAGTELPVSLSYTRSNATTPNQEYFHIIQTGLSNIPSKQLIYGQPLSLVEQLGFQTTLPTTTSSNLQNMYLQNQGLTDNSYDAKADWKIPFSYSDNFSGTFSVGGKFHDVDRVSTQSQVYDYFLYGAGAGKRQQIINYTSYLTALGASYVSITSQDQQGMPAYPWLDKAGDRTSILGYPIGPTFNIYQLANMQDYLYYKVYSNKSLFSANPYYNNGPSDFNQDYTDREKSLAGYVMGELNIGPLLTIVPGARYQSEMTDVSAYHIQINTNNANGLAGVPPVLYGSQRTFANWYPSINIKYKATDNIQVMGAVYQSVSLPSYGDITPLIQYINGPSMTTGNPLLRPSTAWNYDIGASWFNNLIGLFSANFFFKDISNLIYSMQNFFPYEPYPVIAPAVVISSLPAASYYDPSWEKLNNAQNLSATISMNDPDHAYLRGIELSWQTHFWYLPGVLSGLVFDFNVSLMSSNQSYPSFWIKSPKVGNKDTLEYQTVQGPLQNQPKATYNAILGWDYKGFSARFSYRDQKTTVTSIDTRFGLQDYNYGDVTLWDISLKQQIINNLSVFANATNVNDHIDSYYYTHPSYTLANSGGTAPTVYPAGNLPTSEQSYGWILQLGASYSF